MTNYIPPGYIARCFVSTDWRFEIDGETLNNTWDLFETNPAGGIKFHDNFKSLEEAIAAIEVIRCSEIVGACL